MELGKGKKAFDLRSEKRRQGKKEGITGRERGKCR